MAFKKENLTPINLEARVFIYRTDDKVGHCFYQDYFAEAVDEQILQGGDLIHVVAGMGGTICTDSAVVAVIPDTRSHGGYRVHLTGSAFQRMTYKLRLAWEDMAKFF